MNETPRIGELETKDGGLAASNATPSSLRLLLDECLYALNSLPNTKIPDGDGGTTYKLAAKIEMAFVAIDEV